jgi:antirestriction protein ArdC
LPSLVTRSKRHSSQASSHVIRNAKIRARTLVERNTLDVRIHFQPLSGSFGSKKYAHEEIIAEISAAYCCASLGIVPTVRHADYIGSWIDLLREDDRAIVRAASGASKAADFLLAFAPQAINSDVEGCEQAA